MGETELLPLSATLPTVGAMETEVALVELQVSVETWPAKTVAGEALRDTVGTGCVTVTLTVATAVDPFVPLAVAV